MLITFDDGFRNNLLAAEILHELGMNALFFVLTATIDTDFKPWYLRFAHILSTRRQERHALRRGVKVISTTGWLVAVGLPPPRSICWLRLAIERRSTFAAN